MQDVGRTELPLDTVVTHLYVSNFPAAEHYIRQGWRIYTIRMIDGGGMEIDLYRKLG